MEGKTAFILNPLSGGKSSDRKKAPIEKYVASKGYDLFITDYHGHARELTKSLLTDYTTIIAAGGDGTVNEVAGEIVNTNVKLGIIPLGSGNGLAHHLNIPAQIDTALAALDGDAREIDVISINEKIIANVGGLGFDGHIANLFNESARGTWSYVKLIISELLSYKEFPFEIRSAQINTSGTAFIIAFANGSEFGNRFKIDPTAVHNDGIFNIIIVRKPPLYKLPGLLWDSYRGKLAPSRYYMSYPVVEAELDVKDQVIHRDGEVDTDDYTMPLKLKIIRGGLKIIH